MGRNHYAAQLHAAKEDAYKRGVWDGIRMGVCIVAIALNLVFGFAKKRLERLEVKINEIIDEIVRTDEPELTRKHIVEAIRRIRGEDFTL